MRYFLDTEFSETGPSHPIELISIGIVCQDGREYYAESGEFRPGLCNKWVKENVLPRLGPVEQMKSLSLIKEEVRAFIGDGKPEFWGYYSAYDWVVFAQMFGTMMDLPKGWPMYCRDVKQLCDDLGNPKLPEQGKGEHHSLSDARWNRDAYEFLMGNYPRKAYTP